VFGTCKRFNAVSGRVDFKASSFNGMDERRLRQLSPIRSFGSPWTRRAPPGRDSASRVSDASRIRPPPDPLVHEAEMGELGRFTSDREIDIDSAKQPALRQLGVSLFHHQRGRPAVPALLKDPRFRLVEPSQSYYRC